jgi:hypothetical protein
MKDNIKKQKNTKMNTIQYLTRYKENEFPSSGEVVLVQRSNGNLDQVLFQDIQTNAVSKTTSFVFTEMGKSTRLSKPMASFFKITTEVISKSPKKEKTLPLISKIEKPIPDEALWIPKVDENILVKRSDGTQNIVTFKQTSYCPLTGNLRFCFQEPGNEQILMKCASFFSKIPLDLENLVEGTRYDNSSTFHEMLKEVP